LVALADSLVAWLEKWFWRHEQVGSGARVNMMTFADNFFLASLAWSGSIAGAA
jgi:hypothetical protein